MERKGMLGLSPLKKLTNMSVNGVSFFFGQSREFHCSSEETSMRAMCQYVHLCFGRCV